MNEWEGLYGVFIFPSKHHSKYNSHQNTCWFYQWQLVLYFNHFQRFTVSHFTHSSNTHSYNNTKGELIRKHNSLYLWLMWSEVCFHTSVWFILFQQSKQLNQSLFTIKHRNVNIWFWECLKGIYWFDIHSMLSFSLFMFDLKSDNYSVIIRHS